MSVITYLSIGFEFLKRLLMWFAMDFLQSYQLIYIFPFLDACTTCTALIPSNVIFHLEIFISLVRTCPWKIQKDPQIAESLEPQPIFTFIFKNAGEKCFKTCAMLIRSMCEGKVSGHLERHSITVIDCRTSIDWLKATVRLSKSKFHFDWSSYERFSNLIV